ncbi:UNVERIFIED_CONTAM: hypothetical protein GTU68_064075 [Idotea baltica]|nr:hypothetical protein [Idotea baltica]
MVLNFEKKVLKNQELRIKFPDDPKKFMESEIELREAIEEMHVIATVPDLYPLLIELSTVKTLIALLSHDNTDISIAVVDLIQEMTDIEDVDNSDGVEDFVDALIDTQILATLVHNQQRLDESQKQESDGVHNTLGIIENLAEMRPEICNEANPSGLMPWLLKRLRAKMPFDANKLYVSEILAICVQNNAENQKTLPSLEGIDVLLQQLAQYKRHDPSTSEEQEFMENMFDCLSSCLLLPSNREPFLLGEGLQLMNLMLRCVSILLASFLNSVDLLEGVFVYFFGGGAMLSCIDCLN